MARSSSATDVFGRTPSAPTCSSPSTPTIPATPVVVGEEPALGCVVVGLAIPLMVGIAFLWAGSGMVSGRP